MKLGTRRSLLAWSQSSWVAREIERLRPGTEVELVGIETRGDRIQDVPLRSVEGKEFFVAELDEALLSGKVDLSVHSMKDLSLERPKGIRLAAIPARENPRDAILFGPGILEKLKAGKSLKIGTSSPRRLENIPPFLARALPSFGGKGPARLELVEIRGNVNTRLSRVHEPEGSERALDAVVLAFAGLARLWADEKARIELAKLLQGVRWMVLPLRECPAAAAQGALAVECRSNDERTREILSSLHDEVSERAVKVERGLLEEWGGGCHQRFGATHVSHPSLGGLFFVRGVKPDGTFVEELRWSAPSQGSGVARAWDGSEWRQGGSTKTLAPSKVSESAVFVAHSRAVPGDWDGELSGKRIWVSGSASWFRLAERGHWVEGSAEGLGFEGLVATISAAVLQLPALSSWATLTHETASEDGTGRKVATYRVQDVDYPAPALSALGNATHVYWSSGSQFDALGGRAPQSARHACGPGKTAQRLRAAGLKFDVFPSAEEWKRWLT